MSSNQKDYDYKRNKIADINQDQLNDSGEEQDNNISFDQQQQQDELNLNKFQLNADNIQQYNNDNQFTQKDSLKDSKIDTDIININQEDDQIDDDEETKRIYESQFGEDHSFPYYKCSIGLAFVLMLSLIGIYVYQIVSRNFRGHFKQDQNFDMSNNELFDQIIDQNVKEQKDCIFFWYKDKCHYDCPVSTYQFEKTCVTACPDQMKIYEGACIKECPDIAKFELDNICQENCPLTYFKYNEKKCLRECQHYKYEQECFDQCPNTHPFFNDKQECLNNCQKDQKIFQNQCVNSCPNGSFQLEGTNQCVSVCEEPNKILNFKCLKKCPDGMKINGNQCIEHCPFDAYEYEDQSCKPICNYKILMNKCFQKCPDGYKETGKYCEKLEQKDNNDDDSQKKQDQGIQNTTQQQQSSSSSEQSSSDSSNLEQSQNSQEDREKQKKEFEQLIKNEQEEQRKKQEQKDQNKSNSNVDIKNQKKDETKQITKSNKTKEEEISCPQDKFIDYENQECVYFCNNNQYIDFQKQSCQNCPENCQTCTNPNGICLTCKEHFYLQRGQCEQSCEDNFEPDSSDNICKKGCNTKLIQRRIINSKILNREIPYIAILPNEDFKIRKYPSLYFLHDYKKSYDYLVTNEFNIQCAAADNNLVIIGVQGDGNFFIDNEKLNNMLQYKTFILQELIPTATKEFNLLNNYQMRAVSGEGMGTFGALHLYLNQNPHDEESKFFGMVSVMPGKLRAMDYVKLSEYEYVFGENNQNKYDITNQIYNKGYLFYTLKQSQQDFKDQITQLCPFRHQYFDPDQYQITCMYKEYDKFSDDSQDTQSFVNDHIQIISQYYNYIYKKEILKINDKDTE